MQVIQFQSIVLLLLQSTYILAENDPFCSEIDDVECGVSANQVNFTETSVEIRDYREASVNRWPWQVSIRRKQPDGDFRHECSGTLVSPTEVISAAHCLAYSDEVDNYEVQLGVHTLLAGNTTGIVKIKLIAFPEATDLKKLIFPSDIMVISLDSPVKYTDSIRPACIGFVERDLHHATCYVVGWYKSHAGDSMESTSSPLKEARITVNDPNTWLIENRKTDKQSKIICLRNDEKCQSDNGESLVCYVNSKWRLYGIANFRPSCAMNKLSALYSSMHSNSRFLAQCMLQFKSTAKPANMISNCSNRHISEVSNSTIHRIYSTQHGTSVKPVNEASTSTDVKVATSDDEDTCGDPEITPFIKNIDKDTKIIGGDEAKKHSWPWQVSLRRKQSGKFRHECGGTLLSPKVVISAVHCLTFSNDSKEFQVQLGAHNISETNDTVFVNVSQFVYPSDNKPRKLKFPSDIMIVVLEHPVNFTAYISPACVGYEDIDFSNVVCYTTGWGKSVSYESKNTSETLLQLDVPILSSEECQKHVKTNYSAERFMCAGSVGKDTCQGDSGGPLVCQVNQNWRLYGIVSYGDKCGKLNSPGVYTKVSGYSKFLQEHLPSFNNR